ncbi:MAG: hypothetical protein MHM6MM_006288 [Cercozoa sp. M6MM]
MSSHLLRRAARQASTNIPSTGKPVLMQPYCTQTLANPEVFLAPEYAQVPSFESMQFEKSNRVRRAVEMRAVTPGMQMPSPSGMPYICDDEVLHSEIVDYDKARARAHAKLVLCFNSCFNSLHCGCISLVCVRVCLQDAAVADPNLSDKERRAWSKMRQLWLDMHGEEQDVQLDMPADEAEDKVRPKLCVNMVKKRRRKMRKHMYRKRLRKLRNVTKK